MPSQDMQLSSYIPVALGRDHTDCREAVILDKEHLPASDIEPDDPSRVGRSSDTWAFINR